MANYGDINPLTGKPYTSQELMRINSGLDPATGTAAISSLPTSTATKTATPTTTPTAMGTKQIVTISPEDYLARMNKEATPENVAWAKEQLGIIEDKFQGQLSKYGYLPDYPEYTAPGCGMPGCDADGNLLPTFGEGAAANIPTPEVTPAPPYTISPAQQAFEEMYAGILTDWVQNPQGIPEETQAQMIQQQSDSLKAREQENIRVMRNNMERRGITNSGFVYANEQAIRSNTSVAIAGAIADVQIKSALMKMASFEKAMGAAAQFLGYLSEQSQLAYQPEFATWQAEQMAKMQAWQGKMDVYKMELNQAYQTQNLTLQSQLQSQLNLEQHQYDIELAEMEIEANQQMAAAQGAGNLFGTILGFIFGK